jgi:hypothetical protein
MHQGDAPFYVKNVDSISLRQNYKYKEHEGKTIEMDTNFSWMRSSLLASVDVTEFQTEAHSNLDLTDGKYSIYKQSRE